MEWKIHVDGFIHITSVLFEVYWLFILTNQFILFTDRWCCYGDENFKKMLYRQAQPTFFSIPV
jgi:hypothetical protein